MHVHVHLFGRQGEEQQHLGVLAGKDAALVGIARGAREQAVLHRAAVDVEEHALGAVLGVGGPPGQAVGRKLAVLAAELHQPLQHGRRPELGQARGQGLPGGQAEDFAAAQDQGEGHVGPGQGHAREGLLAALGLGGLGAQELEPGRGAGEEPAHLHAGARGQGRRALGQHGAAVHVDARGLGLLAHAGGQGQLRHRGDARQGLAPETKAGDGKEIGHA